MYFRSKVLSVLLDLQYLFKKLIMSTAFTIEALLGSRAFTMGMYSLGLRVAPFGPVADFSLLEMKFTVTYPCSLMTISLNTFLRLILSSTLLTANAMGTSPPVPVVALVRSPTVSFKGNLFLLS